LTVLTKRTYYQRNGEQWLEKLIESGVRQRADHVKD
jgi:hypothetical protein